MILGGSGSGSFLISTEGISAKIVREPFKIWMTPACISLANTGAEKFIFGSKDFHRNYGSGSATLLYVQRRGQKPGGGSVFRTCHLYQISSLAFPLILIFSSLTNGPIWIQKNN